MRIGHGYDVHAFAADRDPAGELTLGGVRIPSERLLLAHSDGDVVLHALADALLGAIAAGDIGLHFPDTDPANRGMDSREILRRCAALVDAAGYRLGNADVTIVAEAPRMRAHVDAMCAVIAADLGARPAQISVKATTTEGLGFVGRREGIGVHAVVLLERLEPSASP